MNPMQYKRLNRTGRITLLMACLSIITLLVISCNENKTGSTGSATGPYDTIPRDVTLQADDDGIGTASATDKTGVKLDMVFNNAKGTATFTLKGETIELKQDTMGSGVKYSNEKYKYTEWHGRIELKKEGKTIFLENEKQ
jgi:membrane-bound inhibitor of C-type lysozyme